METKYKEDVFEFIYAHVSPEYIVSEGMRVLRGDLIGYGGPKYINLNGKLILNGNTTGPHLHFEIRKNNVSVHPLLFLNSLECQLN